MELLAYQKIGRDFMRNWDQRALFLADDMGLGKTAQALATFRDRGIAVTPPGLKYNWQDECLRWRPDLKPVVMVGNGLGSFKWPSTGELVIVGYNQLPEWMQIPPSSSGFAAKDDSKAAKARRKELKAQRKELQARYEKTVKSGVVDNLVMVADEAQYVKNKESSRTRRFRTLSALCSYTRMLTGTPMPRGNPYDLLGILWACHLDQVIFPDYPKFQAMSGVLDGSPPSPAFHAALKPYFLRRLKRDVAAQLPPKRFQTHVIELGAESNAKLETLDPELLAAIRAAQTPLELDKIRAMPAFAEFSRRRKDLARAKIPALIEYVELAEENEDPLLVFSAHREPIEALEKRPGWAAIHGGVPSEVRQQIVRDQKQYKGIAITIKSGGAGLNLAHFAHAVFLDLDWDVTQNQQAEDRMHRHGQEAEMVLYTLFTSSSAIDRLITRKLAAASLNIQIAIDGC